MIITKAKRLRMNNGMYSLDPWVSLIPLNSSLNKLLLIWSSVMYSINVYLHKFSHLLLNTLHCQYTKITNHVLMIIYNHAIQYDSALFWLDKSTFLISSAGDKVMNKNDSKNILKYTLNAIVLTSFVLIFLHLLSILQHSMIQ